MVSNLAFEKQIGPAASPLRAGNELPQGVDNPNHLSFSIGSLNGI